jgi:type II secretory pathway pseudopilin PulG
VILECPKCKARHDVGQRKPGETFKCACENVLVVPKAGGGMSGIIILVIVLVCAVPCLGILAAIAIPNFIKYQQRSKASEVKINMKAIAIAEKSYYGEHEKFVAAGPVPASVPKGVQATFTPDQGFSALAWTPGGPVRFQYEVQLQGPKSAVVVGHGDLNGDGVTSEYKLPLSGEGPMGQMEETNPLE